MLIELPVIRQDDESGIVSQVNGLFRADKIESIVTSDDLKSTLETVKSCELTMDTGDIYIISMSYEYLSKVWQDSLETLSGVFIAKRKRENPSTN